jgi:iron complex outermembrane receptor protein
MKAILTSILFLTFSAVAYGQSGSITGTVTFGGDKSVLHQATVRITPLNRNTVTDDSGVYSFTDVPAGRYSVLVHQEGFGDVSKNVVVAAGATVTADIELQIAGVKEQVTVTASGTEESTFEAIASVSSVDSNKIAERAAVGLGDVVDGEPGVSKRSFGPGNSRPVIRGFDGDRVLVSTDGVRVGSLGSQSGDHGEPVDALSVERIEVVKGPATLLYGSNAIGGVVNAISGHDEGAHPGIRGYFSAIGGLNNNQAATSGGVEYGVGPWMFWGNGSGQRTGDYTAGGDFGKVVNSFTRNASGSGGFGYFGSKAYFNTTYTYYQSRYGIPLDFREADPELRTLRMRRHDVKFNFGYNDPELFVTGIKLTVDLSNYRHQELVSDIPGTTFNNKVNSFRAMFDQRQVGKWSGRFGVEGFRRDYSTAGDEVLIAGKVIQDSFSAFALQELKYERVTFQFGGRLENNRYRPENSSLIKRDFTGFSAAAGARVALWKDGAFVANYTHAYRAPALEELYNNGPHDGTLSFEIGNPNLRAETSDGIDLAVRHQSGRVRAEANFFYYNLKNYVFLAPTGEIDNGTGLIGGTGSGLPIAQYLQGDSRFTGTELSLDVTAHKHLNVLAGLDYVNAELADGTPLPRIAPLRGRLGLDAHFGNFSVRPEVVAVADQNNVFVNETRTPGYAMVNTAATYILPGKHYTSIFSVNAYNLTDKLIYNHISFIKDISPEIGRGVRFSYTIRFY